ncbi:hypothetical protein [Shewanella phaeophyticola]|uniref:Uncharacterized protein n=1 Tax=Shewanella phaeophyticola TaxID=2978345 RepID=A0ABT2P6F6_9GAMM|nr:hypothetical protein [Shewanella sp. KJ10-1]MCT8988209.1 hypothetical protein [Shewanella sp. KJ10-1]
MDIIKEYHYRAQYFDIERWMLSKQLVLHNDHVVASDAQSIQVKQLQQPDLELEEYGGFHGVIDPFTKLQGNNIATTNLNSVTNRVNIAGLVAVSMCNAYASINAADKNNGLMPKFISPNSFLVGINPATANQSDYMLAEGIKFNCVSKRMTKPLPRERVSDIKLTQPILKKGG